MCLLQGLNTNMKEDFCLEQLLAWILQWSRRRLSQRSYIQPLPKPQALPAQQKRGCGITLSVLAVQPKGGTGSASQGGSLMACRRSHQQQHFYLVSAIPPHSFQSLKKRNSSQKSLQTNTNQKIVHVTSSAEVPRTGSANSKNSTRAIF